MSIFLSILYVSSFCFGIVDDRVKHDKMEGLKGPPVTSLKTRTTTFYEEYQTLRELPKSASAIFFTYDPSGKLVKKSYDGGSLTIFKYNHLGYLREETSFDNAGKITSREIFETNTDGKLTKSQDYRAEGSLASENTYIDGKLVKKSYYSTDGSLTVVKSYHYHIDGWIKQIVSNNGDWTRYKYLEDGKVEKESKTFWHKGELLEHKIFLYDKSGNIIENTQYSPFLSKPPFNSQEVRWKYFYEYEAFDRYGNWTKVKQLKLVNKFGEKYYEPVEACYRDIVYQK